ncbi:4582_t:CDS:1 [Acaulospora morrowiae]|uniref:4582_t:CDS:1 n=1 Tax=Acaulospora morrowiae TaxID=94023 RepID=A0A9N9HRI9_9GLOM|nr:4582_t:CDS:1 [Acaulospora morrowiae]
MGSAKSFRYEVLVYPPKEQLLQQPNVTASSNSVHQQFMLQTQARRFSCDRENMQQYWVPDGYRPVLVHRDLLKFSLAATNDVNDSRQTTSTAPAHHVPNLNVSPLKQRTTTNTAIDSHRSKRRRRILVPFRDQGQPVHPGISQRTFYAAALYYKVKCKELTANGIISNPPVEPPSRIIGKMWYEEPESVRRRYERLAHRIKMEHDCKRSKNSTCVQQSNQPRAHESHVNERPTVQPGEVFPSATSERHYHSNVCNNNHIIQYHVPRKSDVSRRGSLSNNIKGNRDPSSDLSDIRI